MATSNIFAESHPYEVMLSFHTTFTQLLSNDSSFLARSFEL